MVLGFWNLQIVGYQNTEMYPQFEKKTLKLYAGEKTTGHFNSNPSIVVPRKSFNFRDTTGKNIS